MQPFQHLPRHRSFYTLAIVKHSKTILFLKRNVKFFRVLEKTALGWRGWIVQFLNLIEKVVKAHIAKHRIYLINTVSKNKSRLERFNSFRNQKFFIHCEIYNCLQVFPFESNVLWSKTVSLLWINWFVIYYNGIVITK